MANDYGTGPLGDPLPQNAVVTVAMTALSGAAIALTGDEFVVALDPPATAEVQLT